MGWKPLSLLKAGSPFSRVAVSAYGIGLLLGLTILLGGYAYKGIFSRYLQDDYCYGAQVRSADFITAQVNSYLWLMPYNSDRFSLTLFSGFAEYLGGPALVPALPALSIMSWLAALFLLERQWQKLACKKVNGLASLAAAAAVLFFTLLLAPNLYQVLYWRSAMVPYLTPLVIITGLLALFLWQAQRASWSWPVAAPAAIIAFIAGGFSETIAFWQGALWACLLALSLIVRPLRKNAILFSAAFLVATLAAILVMALSPVNSAQLSPFHRPDLQRLVEQSLANASIFIRVALKKQMLPFAVIAVCGFLSGLVNLDGSLCKFRRTIVRLCVLALFIFLLILAIMVPTMLAMSDYPGERAQLPGYFTLVVVSFMAGWILAQWAGSWKIGVTDQPLLRVMVAILAVAVLIYFLNAIPGVYSGISPLQHRAEAWDQRQAWIISERTRGETHIVVPAFDSIAQILELYPEENFWVNVCAARYYQVSGISAIEGYNGIKPIFK